MLLMHVFPAVEAISDAEQTISIPPQPRNGPHLPDLQTR